MSTERNLTPEGFRTAAYLEARARMDFRSGKAPKCKPPNRACGDRCIPPNWKCRVKGEGTDSHSRVVAGDPLAGIASIDRGQKRLRKGLSTGNISDIQGGRAAIERGIVKAVPGQNIKQKQALRAGVQKAMVPVAATLFGIWAIGRGHDGLKGAIPQYRKGIGRQIEEAAGDALNWGLDRVPLLGKQRVAGRRLGALQAQRLGLAVTRGIQRNPQEALNNAGYFPSVSSQGKRGAFNGLDSRIKDVYDRNRVADQKSYPEFRADMMRELIKFKDGDHSAYSDTATAQYLARQFSLDRTKTIDSNGIESGYHVKNRLNAALTEARDQMRADMEIRGLDPRNLDHVDRYTEIATRNAAVRMTGLSADDQKTADTHVRGFIRDLVAAKSNKREEKRVSSITDLLYNDTRSSFDTYFNKLGDQVYDNINPRNSVVASTIRTESDNAAHRAALIGTASRLRKDISMTAPIAGANHAELVLQKVYHERSLPGNYAAKRTFTWQADDTDIRYAAQDLGWQGRDLDDAVEFLRGNGFEKLARRPAAASRATRTPKTPSASGGGRKRNRVNRSPEGEAVYQLMRENPGMSLEAARREIRRQRGDSEDLPLEAVRAAAYLLTRNDLREGSRLGKPCGQSHIPKTHECRKGQGSLAHPESPTAKAPSSSHLRRNIAIAAVVAAVGAIGVTVAMDAHRFYNSNELPNPPGYREAIRAAQGGNPKVSYDVAIGKHYDKIVSEEGWKPGELVYTRFGSGGTQKDPTAHFAVYMGKQGDRHQFADFGVKDVGSREGIVHLYEYGPGVKGVAPFVFIKAPPLKGSGETYSSEQIQQRVFASIGARMKYDAIENNCENWARMITTGKARSTQIERLSKLTQSLYKYYDRKAVGASPRDIPSVKQQARILDMQARVASGDKNARTELRAFQELIKKGKRTDGMQQEVENELPTPEEVLASANSDAEALVRTKLYLMLLIRLGEARAYAAD